jgi:hypothetical protein
MGKSGNARSLMLTAAFVVCAFFAGCGGGGGGGSADSGGATGSVSYNEMTAAMDGVDSALKGISSTDGTVRLQAIGQYLSGRSEFAETGVSTSGGNAWGRMSTGEIVCVVDTLPKPTTGAVSLSEASTMVTAETKAPAASNSASKAAGSSSSLVTKALSADRTEMPAGINAHIVSADTIAGYGHKNALGVYASVLTGHGYISQYGSEIKELFANGTLERLGALQDVGVLYMHTIVSAGKLPDGTEVAALLTSTDVTPSTEATYRALLRDGSLVIMDVPNNNIADCGGPERLRRFGITSKYIRERVKISQNALVYIDAGYGNHADIRQAFMEIGASVYLGWEKMPSTEDITNQTTRFFFQHIMADDSYNPDGINSWPDSASRPFDYSNVYSAMFSPSFKCGRDPDNLLIYLALTEGGGTLAILAPSIRYMRVEENPPGSTSKSALLHLYGSFGSDPGSDQRDVVITQASGPGTGEKLNVVSWTPSEIVCDISTDPFEGFTSGKVFVLNRNIASNGVPLTEWFLPVTYYDVNSYGAFTRSTFGLHIRLDVHGYRAILNQPIPTPVPPSSLYMDNYANYTDYGSVANDSTGDWRCFANYDVIDQGTQLATTWYMYDASGSFIYRYDYPGTTSGFYASAVPAYDSAGAKRIININLRYYAIGGQTSWGHCDIFNGNRVMDPSFHDPITFTSAMGSTPGDAFTVELGDDYSIKPGSSTVYPLSWEQAPASDHSAPSKEDQR